MLFTRYFTEKRVSLVFKKCLKNIKWKISFFSLWKRNSHPLLLAISFLKESESFEHFRLYYNLLRLIFIRCVLLHEFKRSCYTETEKRFRVSIVHVWKTRAAFTFDSSRETMVGEAEYVASGIADRRRAAEQFISVMAAVWRCR